ncbi:hypothetical protein ACFSBW_15230 [Halohasta litorea]|uniref:Uncharacterized protein n=1 Tax=Halohasta litorea TaxID=869891 RepID=A0ABD6DA99_9EURY
MSVLVLSIRVDARSPLVGIFGTESVVARAVDKSAGECIEASNFTIL